jgi:hypothetical protein
MLHVRKSISTRASFRSRRGPGCMNEFVLHNLPNRVAMSLPRLSGESPFLLRTLKSRHLPSRVDLETELPSGGPCRRYRDMRRITMLALAFVLLSFLPAAVSAREYGYRDSSWVVVYDRDGGRDCYRRHHRWHHRDGDDWRYRDRDDWRYRDRDDWHHRHRHHWDRDGYYR